MQTRPSIRLYAAACLTVSLFVASPASAPYRPPALDDPATGESFHIEGAIEFWNASADIIVASQSLSTIGSQIDFKNDLGLVDQRLPEYQLVVRPSRRHKFRFQYLPIHYEQTATLTRNITFNGQVFKVGVPVESSLDWKSYRFGYEFDFLVKNRGFGGFILEAKYTDVMAQLETRTVGVVSLTEAAHARAPVPALGGIGRVYVVPNISITGEMTVFKLPAAVDQRFDGHYFDLDIYGTVNFTNNIGVQAGYRSLDVDYLIKTDSGALTLSGLYFGVVARY